MADASPGLEFPILLSGITCLRYQHVLQPPQILHQSTGHRQGHQAIRGYPKESHEDGFCSESLSVFIPPAPRRALSSTSTSPQPLLSPSSPRIHPDSLGMLSLQIRLQRQSGPMSPARHQGSPTTPGSYSHSRQGFVSTSNR